jgi:hypothetical protein
VKRGEVATGRKWLIAAGNVFDDPIPLPRGRQLVTLKDAGNYITKLPKAEHELPECPAVTQRAPLVRFGAGGCPIPAHRGKPES